MCSYSAWAEAGGEARRDRHHSIILKAFLGSHARHPLSGHPIDGFLSCRVPALARPTSCVAPSPLEAHGYNEFEPTFSACPERIPRTSPGFCFKRSRVSGIRFPREPRPSSPSCSLPVRAHSIPSLCLRSSTQPMGFTPPPDRARCHRHGSKCAIRNHHSDTKLHQWRLAGRRETTAPAPAEMRDDIGSDRRSGSGFAGVASSSNQRNSHRGPSRSRLPWCGPAGGRRSRSTLKKNAEAVLSAPSLNRRVRSGRSGSWVPTVRTLPLFRLPSPPLAPKSMPVAGHACGGGRPHDYRTLALSLKAHRDLSSLLQQRRVRTAHSLSESEKLEMVAVAGLFLCAAAGTAAASSFHSRG